MAIGKNAHLPKKVCPKCRGRGKLKCTACKGKGKPGDCPNCGNEEFNSIEIGSIKCWICSGKGSILRN